MKLVCAWCQKVIREGPGKTVSHGICPECARRVTRRVSASPYCRGTYGSDRLWGSLVFIVLAGLLWLLAALASEGLHWASGGRVPRFVRWELPQPPPTPALRQKASQRR